MSLSYSVTKYNGEIAGEPEVFEIDPSQFTKKSELVYAILNPIGEALQAAVERKDQVKVTETGFISANNVGAESWQFHITHDDLADVDLEDDIQG